MLTTQWIIDNILKKKSIVEYLSEKKIYPSKSMSCGRLAYLCPFKDHKETKPSFIVYTTDCEFQNFYCFGCGRSCHLIHLIKYLDGGSTSEIIDKLCDSDISISSKMESEIDSYAYNLLSSIKDSSISVTLTNISDICRFFLKSVNNDEKEKAVINQVWSLLDKCIIESDFVGIDEIYQRLPNLIDLRREKFIKNKKTSNDSKCN